jgi:hypothetical protein
VCETFRPFASALFVVRSSSLRDSVPATILDQDIFGEELLLEDWSLEEDRRLVSFVFEGLPTAPTEASLQFYKTATGGGFSAVIVGRGIFSKPLGLRYHVKLKTEYGQGFQPQSQIKSSTNFSSQIFFSKTSQPKLHGLRFVLRRSRGRICTCNTTTLQRRSRKNNLSIWLHHKARGGTTRQVFHHTLSTRADSRPAG